MLFYTPVLPTHSRVDGGSPVEVLTDNAGGGELEVGRIVVYRNMDGKVFVLEHERFCQRFEPLPARTQNAVFLNALPTLISFIGANIHRLNETWWRDPFTGEPLKRNVGEILCLVHSEISEAMEGHRKSLADDKLPHRTMFAVEIADTLVRLFDIVGAGSRLSPENEDVAGAMAEKIAYNLSRADHKPENRIAPGGKKF